MWAPGPVWTGGKSRPTGIRSPDRPSRSSVAVPTELPGPPRKVKRQNDGISWCTGYSGDRKYKLKYSPLLIFQEIKSFLSVFKINGWDGTAEGKAK